MSDPVDVPKGDRQRAAGLPGGTLETQCINTLRTLAMDAVERARSGHPGTPMGLAPLAYALWTRVMRYDSSAPSWPDRDRFVLSCGHASMLLYGVLHLTGYPISLEEIRAFRQLGSPAAGHPEYGEVPGIETTTGPLGQGVGNAVGMALAERMLAARFNRPGHEVVNHRTWVIASDGDLMEGVCAEAVSLAGHLGLDRLCVFWDDNRITIDGATDLSFSEDVGARFAAYGWNVLRVDVSEGVAAYEAAAAQAAAQAERPTLVICRTHIGHGSPGVQDTSAAHGAPLGPAEVRATKRALDWPEDAEFLVPEHVREHMGAAGVRGRAARGAWESRLSDFSKDHPELSREFERVLKGELPMDWEGSLPHFAPGASMATRQASGKVLSALATSLPELVGGSADLAGSNNTTIPGSTDVRRGEYSGRTLHFGVREHAMGAVLNGIALHGGLRPYGGTFLIFSDYMRPAIRLAAIMRLPVIYVFTHDSIGVGEDGPTHQPIEHLASLRAIPGLRVVRPCDAAETAEAWRLALASRGPVALCLTRQGLPTLDRTRMGAASGLQRGGYVLLDGGARPDVALLATGSEVHVALGAAERLRGEGVKARVISMPCWEQFEALSRAAQEEVFGGCTVRVAIEAASPQGWHRWVGPYGEIVAMNGFGASAPIARLMEHFGFTAERVAEVARRALAQAEHAD